MVLRKQGVLILVGVAALALAIALLFLLEPVQDEPLRLLVRFFALYGYLFLSIAVLTTPFLKEIILAFGKPFLTIHHSFAVIGILLITLHPVSNAVQRVSLSVFVPRLESWLAFWTFGGRLAFIIFYIAVAAALLRKNAPKHWRLFHASMYVVLFFGIVHAFLIGKDFNNMWIRLIFSSLFAASMAAFAIKRFKNYQLGRQRVNQRNAEK